MAPTASISFDQSSLTDATNSTLVTFAFSEPVSGFTIDDVIRAHVGTDRQPLGIACRRDDPRTHQLAHIHRSKPDTPEPTPS